MACSGHLAPWWAPADHPAACGATAVVLMNVSGRDPDGTLRFYGNEVLPRLRG